MVEPALLNHGWHLSKEGLQRCKNGVPEAKADSIMRNALDIDLRHIGLQAFPTDTSKGKVDQVQGPMVLQIQKIRNISAPKANEDSVVAPPLLRLQLTDGHMTIMAVVLSNITKISMSTPPGSKLKLPGCVSINHGFLLLTDSNCKLLGGNVEELIQRWQLAKSLAQHTRSAVSGTGGPPPWIPFGQRGRQGYDNQKPSKITIKKSLEDPKPKELTEQDKEFEEQRKAAIQEVNKNKQGQGKTFGGTKTAVTSHGREPAKRGYENNHGGRNSRRGDQFEDQAPGGKPRSEGIYRDLDYGGYQPIEKNIQQLVTMGFQRDAASNALRKHAGNIDGAVEMLVTQSGTSQMEPNRYEKQIPDTRPERGHGRKGRRGGDEEEEASAPPAAPATLFDFLQPKLGKDKGKASEQSSDFASRKDTSKPRNFAKEQPYSVCEAGISFVHKDKGQGSNSSQLEHQQDNKQRGYNSNRNTTDNYGSRREDFNRGNNYAGNDSRDRRQDYNQHNPKRSTQDFDGKSGSRRDDFNKDQRYGGNDRGGRKHDFNSGGYYPDKSKRDFDEKAGPRKDNLNRGQRHFVGNDSEDRKQDRSYDKENSNYRVGGSFRDRRDDKEQTEMNQQRREGTQNELITRENKASQREGMSHGGLQRSSDIKADYQDSRPPRFQKHNDTQNESVNPNHRNKQRDDGAPPPQSSSHYQGTDAPHLHVPPLRPGGPCQAKYWEDGQFYNAVLTAVHPSGRTCVVLFPEYGNHEEVKMTDVRPIASQAWIRPSQPSPGPTVPTLLMSANPGEFTGSTNSRLEFRKGGEGMSYQKSRQQREPRQNTRPSQNLYQPPVSRK